MSQEQAPKPKPALKVANMYRKEYNGKVSWSGKAGSLTYVIYENGFKQKADDADFQLYVKESPKLQGQQQWQQRPSPAQSRQAVETPQHPYAPKAPPKNFAPQSVPPGQWDPEDPGPDPEF